MLTMVWRSGIEETVVHVAKLCNGQDKECETDTTRHACHGQVGGSTFEHFCS